MSSARVLVVEDNPRIGEKLQEVLSRSGFAATLARDGAAALDLFSRARFDLVVVEHLVPGVEGGRLVDRLRALDDEVPVVVMAASARAQTRLTQQGSGFIQGFLLKPFRVPDLLQAVSAAAHKTTACARPQERFVVKKEDSMTDSIVNDSLVSNVADLV